LPLLDCYQCVVHYQVR